LGLIAALVAVAVAPAASNRPSPLRLSLTSTQTINSVDKIVYDMKCCNEGHPHGVPPSYSWYNGPVVVAGSTPPRGYRAVIAWGTLYADSSNTHVSNVRVEMRNIEFFVWSKSRRTWIQVEGSRVVGGRHFPESFQGNSSVPASLRREPDGGVSVTMVNGYNFHFWPDVGRAAINPADLGGVFTTYEARLILDNPTGPDNRAGARLLADAGGDYWQSTTASYPNNRAAMIGRYGYLTSAWKAFNSHAWTEPQVRQHPPPLDATPLSP
jgi:hypothetical protein